MLQEAVFWTAQPISAGHNHATFELLPDIADVMGGIVTLTDFTHTWTGQTEKTGETHIICEQACNQI